MASCLRYHSPKATLRTRGYQVPALPRWTCLGPPGLSRALEAARFQRRPVRQRRTPSASRHKTGGRGRTPSAIRHKTGGSTMLLQYDIITLHHSSLKSYHFSIRSHRLPFDCAFLSIALSAATLWDRTRARGNAKRTSLAPQLPASCLPDCLPGRGGGPEARPSVRPTRAGKATDGFQYHRYCSTSLRYEPSKSR